MHTKMVFLVAVALCLSRLSPAQRAWHPVPGPLTTPWTAGVDPTHDHPEYPRPQMERSEWKNLNGLWHYAVAPLETMWIPETGTPPWQGSILVPFPIESSLSGVGKKVGPEASVWYERSFTVPSGWSHQRVLLHFGAVDWQATVWINGRKVGSHRGGYDPFSFDITDALKSTGSQTLTVSVWDPSDSGFQPAGKQSLDPRGIWYTSSTGIWQTVWLEPVPPVSIGSLRMIPDIDAKTLRLTVQARGNADGYTVKATALAGGREVASVTGRPGDALALHLPQMRLWSPDDPFLYGLKVTLYRDGKQTDGVQSYFGMRKISLGKDALGITRLLLNNKPLFQYGPLDQGFWPDGIYTAPSDSAMRFDIEKTKAWGFNMIRKHVKVEPERWYYWCDRIGLLVWQDMPSGDRHIRRKDPDIERVAQSAYDYKKELARMIDAHYNHPSIVTWVLFNEGWGQFRTAEITQLARTLDPTRLLDATTGWADREVGDMHDMHQYPGPGMFPATGNRASVLGEFGGQALVVKGHLWLTDFSRAPSHYKTSQSDSALHERYRMMTDSLAALRKKGLAATVYTQTTDVEIEVNGIMTYDRRVVKFDEAHFKALNEQAIGKKE